MALDHEQCAVTREVGRPLADNARVVATSCAEPLASATGVSVAIEEVVSETLSTVRPGFALAIESNDDGTAQLGAATSVDGRWHWVEGQLRASITLPRWGDCGAEGCTILESQWQMPVETGSEDFVSFELLDVAFIEHSSEACDERFAAHSAEPILRLQVMTLSNSRLSLTGPGQGVSYLCVVTPMVCADEERAQGIPCEQCGGWLTTFDLQFDVAVSD